MYCYWPTDNVLLELGSLPFNSNLKSYCGQSNLRCEVEQESNACIPMWAPARLFKLKRVIGSEVLRRQNNCKMYCC